jgi:hypothetical protein
VRWPRGAPPPRGLVVGPGRREFSPPRRCKKCSAVVSGAHPSAVPRGWRQLQGPGYSRTGDRRDAGLRRALGSAALKGRDELCVASDQVRDVACGLVIRIELRCGEAERELRLGAGRDDQRTVSELGDQRAMQVGAEDRLDLVGASRRFSCVRTPAYSASAACSVRSPSTSTAATGMSNRRIASTVADSLGSGPTSTQSAPICRSPSWISTASGRPPTSLVCRRQAETGASGGPRNGVEGSRRVVPRPSSAISATPPIAILRASTCDCA